MGRLWGGVRLWITLKRSKKIEIKKGTEIISTLIFFLELNCDYEYNLGRI